VNTYVALRVDPVDTTYAAVALPHDWPQDRTVNVGLVARAVVPGFVAFMRASVNCRPAGFEVGCHLLVKFRNLAVHHSIAASGGILVVRVQKHQAALRMPNQYQRRFEAGCHYQSVQVLDRVGSGTWAHSRITESIARSIVDARSRGVTHGWLYVAPVPGLLACAPVKDYLRATVASAVEIQMATLADVNALVGNSILCSFRGYRQCRGILRKPSRREPDDREQCGTHQQ
jgi:hypothetical protein